MRGDEGGHVRRGELWKRQDSSGLHKGTVILLLVGQLFLISVCVCWEEGKVIMKL